MVAQVPLTDSQRRAVEHPWKRKICMIVSTAGSGKTLVLTHRAVSIAKDLVSQGEFGARLLCVCYNRNAADEMRDRIATFLHESNLVDQIFVSRDSATMPNMVTIEVRTFHALGFYILKSSFADQRSCINLDERHIYAMTGDNLKTKFFQALQINGLLSGPDTEKLKRSYIAMLLKELSIEKGVFFDQKCGELLKTGKLDHRFRDQREEFEVYENMLSEYNSVDYSDMVRKTVILLHHSQKTKQRITKRYHSVLVDEFQDMSASQVYICKSLVDETNSLTLVGDDDQQIYSFRTGVGWCCYEFLRSIFSEIDTLTLTENHRCSGAVVKAAYAVINNNTNRVTKEIKAVRAKGLPVHVIACKNQQLEMDFVVKRVRALLPKARKHGHRILLLFRRNKLLLDYQRRFTRERIHTTRKATSPQKTKRIGSLALRAYSLFCLLNPNITPKDFVWAAVAVAPCIEETFLRDVLKSQEGMANCDTPGLRQQCVQGDGEKDENSDRLQNLSPLLWKVRQWCESHIDSLDDGERCCGELLQTLLAIIDSANRKSKTTSRLEDLVQFSATLLNNPGVSESMLSSQSAIDYEAEGQVSSYGTEDPDGQGLDSEAYDILVSAARELDEKAVLQRGSTEERADSSKLAETNDQGSDEEDFAQMFCRDRDIRKSKRRRATGINPVSADQREALVDRDFRQKQVEQLCVIAGERFKKTDKEWQRIQPSRDAITVLSTAHGAKGCTFPYVFLCGADNNAFPVGGNTPLFTDPIAQMWGSYEQLQVCTPNFNDPVHQEERRLFFVALTRTVTDFVCTYSSQGIGAAPNSSQSPFIQEMLQGLQWDPDYITESFVNCHEDFDKPFVPMKKSKGEGIGISPVKEEQECQ